MRSKRAKEIRKLDRIVDMDTIGGFRLVRRLGTGTRAEVHLGRSVAPGDDARTVAVKVFRPTTATTSIDDEIESLARCSSRFLARLEDLTMAPDGRPVLIMGRVGPVSLAELCLRRETIGPGEAVTVLAPLADAVHELHRVGVAHGNLRMRAVHFDDLGAPVIIGFGRARIVGPMPLDGAASSLTPAVLEATSVVRTDLDDLRAIARTVLESTPPTSDRSALIDWLADDGFDPLTFCSVLRDTLFEFAAPTPVRTAHPVGPVALPSRPPPESERSEPEPLLSRRLFDLLHLPVWLEDLVLGGRLPADVDRPREPERGALGALSRGSSTSSPTLVERVKAFLAPVRRPVWVTAGVVVALLAVAVTVVGVDDDGAADASNDRASTGRASIPSPLPSDPSTATSPDESVARSDASQAEQREDTASAIEGADPVAAVAALVSERNRCFEERSMLCLDGVDQISSAAIDADIHAIEAGQGSAASEDLAAEDPAAEGQGDEGRGTGRIPSDQPDLTTGVPELTEELGGSAIVTMRFDDAGADAPLAVTVLVVRGESGWRIRDLVFE